METSSAVRLTGITIFVPGNIGIHTYGDARSRESDQVNHTRLSRRTLPKTHSRGEQATVYGQSSPYARLHTISKIHRLSQKRTGSLNQSSKSHQ